MRNYPENVQRIPPVKDTVKSDRTLIYGGVSKETKL